MSETETQSEELDFQSPVENESDIFEIIDEPEVASAENTQEAEPDTVEKNFETEPSPKQQNENNNSGELSTLATGTYDRETGIILIDGQELIDNPGQPIYEQLKGKITGGETGIIGMDEYITTTGEKFELRYIVDDQGEFRIESRKIEESEVTKPEEKSATEESTLETSDTEEPILVIDMTSLFSELPQEQPALAPEPESLFAFAFAKTEASEAVTVQESASNFLTLRTTTPEQTTAAKTNIEPKKTLAPVAQIRAEARTLQTAGVSKKTISSSTLPKRIDTTNSIRDPLPIISIRRISQTPPEKTAFSVLTTANEIQSPTLPTEPKTGPIKVSRGKPRGIKPVLASSARSAIDGRTRSTSQIKEQLSSTIQLDVLEMRQITLPLENKPSQKEITPDQDSKNTSVTLHASSKPVIKHSPPEARPNIQETVRLFQDPSPINPRSPIPNISPSSEKRAAENSITKQSTIKTQGSLQTNTGISIVRKSAKGNPLLEAKDSPLPTEPPPETPPAEIFLDILEPIAVVTNKSSSLPKVSPPLPKKPVQPFKKISFLTRIFRTENIKPAPTPKTFIRPPISSEPRQVNRILKTTPKETGPLPQIKKSFTRPPQRPVTNRVNLLARKNTVNERSPRPTTTTNRQTAYRRPLSPIQRPTIKTQNISPIKSILTPHAAKAPRQEFRARAETTYSPRQEGVRTLLYTSQGKRKETIIPEDQKTTIQNTPAYTRSIQTKPFRPVDERLTHSSQTQTSPTDDIYNIEDQIKEKTALAT